MSPVRPIFQEGERLTSRRLNAAVEYLRNTLRRVLLAPLSPGVATGLELSPPIDSPTISVSAGVAIEGRGRLLVLAEPLTFDVADVQAQIADLGVGDRFSICLMLDDRSASFDPCAPHLPLEVVENVKLGFRKIPVVAGVAFPPATLLAFLQTFAPALHGAWDELDPAGRTSAEFCVRLGHATWDGANFVGISMSDRTGVVPRFSGVRNSFGDPSLALGRDVLNHPHLGVAVPTTFGATAPAVFQAPVGFQTALVVAGQATFEAPVSFLTTAGGAQVQAAMVAKDVNSVPAGRVNPQHPEVFEAAGGRTGAPLGASGVLAVSMEYDVALGTTYLFPTVPHAGVPLALSNGPKVAPFVPSAVTSLVGLSASASYLGTSSATLVPVATSGVVQAYVTASLFTPFPVGTPLTPDDTNIVPGSQYPLRPASTTGEVVVALLGVPVPGTGGTPLVAVWITAPYPLP